jgi:DNA-directed RNA polymerase specialized sigma24 family protein
VSLTGPLRAGDPVLFGRLYDEHAERLYTYCRAMAGDEAAAALRDAFTAATRTPGPGEDGPRIWLYGLVRAECQRRDPPPGPTTAPLERAAARLRREHREVLVLAASLETADVARVLGVATDTAQMLHEMARRRLAQAARAVVGADATGRLHELVTRAYEPPPGLRDQVLVACSAAGHAAAGALLFDESGMPIAPEDLFGPAEAATSPLARVQTRDPEAGRGRRNGRGRP